jgi:hypothetical protein
VFDSLDQVVDHRPVEAASSQSFPATHGLGERQRALE